MKILLKALTFSVIAFMVTGQFTVQAQGVAGNPIKMVSGTVAAVDTNANTITVQGRGQDVTPTIVKVNSLTRYQHQVSLEFTDIRVGTTVFVRSSSILQPTDTTVNAASVEILPIAGILAGAGVRGNSVVGTVISDTPSLTIKDGAGATITIMTSATTRYLMNKQGSLSDITIGDRVSITTMADAFGAVTAKIVLETLARRPGQGDATALPNTVAKPLRPAIVIRPLVGEIELTGKVLSISNSSQSLTLSAASVATNDGKTTTFSTPRLKKVLIAQIDLGTLSGIQIGDVINVVGQDSGVGKPITARDLAKQ